MQSTLTRKTLCVKPASESLGRCSQLGRRGESIYGTAGSYFPCRRGMDHSDAELKTQPTSDENLWRFMPSFNPI